MMMFRNVPLGSFRNRSARQIDDFRVFDLETPLWVASVGFVFGFGFVLQILLRVDNNGHPWTSMNMGERGSAVGRDMNGH